MIKGATKLDVQSNLSISLMGYTVSKQGKRSFYFNTFNVTEDAMSYMTMAELEKQVDDMEINMASVVKEGDLYSFLTAGCGGNISLGKLPDGFILIGYIEALHMFTVSAIREKDRPIEAEQSFRGLASTYRKAILDVLGYSNDTSKTHMSTVDLLSELASFGRDAKRQKNVLTAMEDANRVAGESLRALLKSMGAKGVQQGTNSLITLLEHEVSRIRQQNKITVDKNAKLAEYAKSIATTLGSSTKKKDSLEVLKKALERAEEVAECQELLEDVTESIESLVNKVRPKVDLTNVDVHGLVEILDNEFTLIRAGILCDEDCEDEDEEEDDSI